MILQYLSLGAEALFSVANLLAIIGGTVMGIAFGALPGFTASMGIAVLIPLTFGMEPITGLALLGGIYCGGCYGGSITACLINTPGAPSACCTMLDGYPMTQQGRAGEALTESVVASFWGGVISVFFLLFLAPPLANAALKFGPPEMFWLAIFGLTIVVSLTAENIMKGFFAAVIGLLLGCVGQDPIYGTPRFCFGEPSLYSGFALIPAMIGLFSASQIYSMIMDGSKSIVTSDDINVKEIKVERPRWRDMVRYPIVYIRSGLIGTFIGAVPAAGASIAAYLGYNEGKRFSKHPELFGKGSREGIASCEAANNAVSGGSLITMMTLGVPGNSTTAILMGGLMIQGLSPGFELFTTHADISYGFMLSLFFANIVMLLVGLYCAKYFAKLVKLPINCICAMVFVLGVMGAYAVSNNIFNVWVMFAFGLLGFIFKLDHIDTSPVILGLILGPLAEKGISQSISIASGLNVSVVNYMFHRPVCLVLMLISFASLLSPLFRSPWFKSKVLKKTV